MSIFDPVTFIYFETSDTEARKAALGYIEEGQEYDLGKGWRVRSDPPHTTGMMRHNHVYLRGKEMFAINRDGTPSHGSDLSTMPNRILDALKKKRLVETSSMHLSADLLAELVTSALELWERTARTRRLMQSVGRPQIS